MDSVSLMGAGSARSKRFLMNTSRATSNALLLRLMMHVMHLVLSSMNQGAIRHISSMEDATDNESVRQSFFRLR